MQTLEASTYGQGRRENTSFVTDDTCLVTRSSRDDREQRWQVLIDVLTDWAMHPEELDEDGLEPPTQDVIQRAAWLACNLCEAGVRPPTRIVPNGDGGLAFESLQGDEFEALEIQNDLSVEFTFFKNSALKQRIKLA
ncbi:MAG: hypothetical protein O3B01_15980 [Planctomycetota bacterium]|nr:hypothetical protein [Planctomycetota bacterium]MDA1140073.1 hypothetical protein [Planctomycetota bacterium]